MSSDKVYGRTVKFYRPGFLGVTVQAVTSQAGSYTVNMQFAKPFANSREYDWAKALTLQLTKDELPEVCLVVLRLKEQTNSGYHGESNNKSFLFQHDNDKGTLRIEVSGPGQRNYIDLSKAEQLWFSDLLIEQTMKNMGATTVTDLMNLLARIYR